MTLGCLSLSSIFLPGFYLQFILALILTTLLQGWRQVRICSVMEIINLKIHNIMVRRDNIHPECVGRNKLVHMYKQHFPVFINLRYKKKLCNYQYK